MILSINIFDRKGNVLFAKSYNKANAAAAALGGEDEARKLIFGMVFSLKEMCNTLYPQAAKERNEKISVIKTTNAHLHMMETGSGMRFVIYTTACLANTVVDLQPALHYIYSLWVDVVVRSPLYDAEGGVDVSLTLFEPTLSGFLEKHPAYR